MSGALYAAGNFEADTFSFKFDKERLSQLRKDYNNYKREIRKLADKYNQAEASQKPMIRTEMENLISSRTDQELIHKKELVNSVQAVIKEIETNKKAYVSKKFELFLIPEAPSKKKSKSKK
jgi:hypothetical protein